MLNILQLEMVKLKYASMQSKLALGAIGEEAGVHLGDCKPDLFAIP
jgi:hypothetical protein